MATSHNAKNKNNISPSNTHKDNFDNIETSLQD